MTIPIFFDTETTGLSAQSERIIEIAALNAKTGQSFVRLINPGRPIPPEASNIHKITDEMVQQAPTFLAVATEFIEFCKAAAKEVQGPCKVALIAHNNIAFDLPFLKAEFDRNGLNLPSEWVFLDSLYWAKHYRSDLPRHALQYLRQIYGIEANQAHRALDDVVVLKEVFQAMVDDLEFDWVVQKLLSLQPMVAVDKGKPSPFTSVNTQ